jgi:hypothetical protein
MPLRKPRWQNRQPNLCKMKKVIPVKAHLCWMELQRLQRLAPHQPSHLYSKRRLIFKKSVSIKSFSKMFFLRQTDLNPSPLHQDPWQMKNVWTLIAHLMIAKGPSSMATKALKPMVRSRLSNMGGASMQRQGSGSSTPKSGRGSSPNFGRTGSGSDVWSWRRQPAAAREYSEEELQKQGVHLTARLTASTGDDANKWADVCHLTQQC